MSMADFIDAGKLDSPAQLLELRETAAGVWEWVAVRQAWARIELQNKTNLFSKVGIGARDASIVIRRQSISLHNALRCGGRHFFLTSIVQRGRNHLDIGAAVVTMDIIQLIPAGEKSGMTFPGVLTEKYMGHTQEWPMSANELRLVLVVPKPIVLRPGSLVGARGAEWEVLVPHELDAFKNEYEIGRTVDL